MPQPDVTFRRATREDVLTIVKLIADDPLGAKRELGGDSRPDYYHKAFEAIEKCADTELVVAESGGKIIGTFQITYTPNLNFQGRARATIESVHVDASARDRGIGTAMMRRAIEMANMRGCGIVQLTTHKSRVDAKRFYERLGFQATHEGMKLYL